MPTALSKKNQIHQPAKAKKRIDKNGNDRRKVYFKSGNSSMLLCKGVTENGAKVILNVLENILTDLDTKLEGKLIWTK